MKNIQEYLQKIQEYAKGLTLQQKIFSGGSLLVLIGAVVFLAYLNNRVVYAPLFSGLSESDMGEIVHTLKAKKIPYRVLQDRIDVPKAKVYETRLSLAASGIPKGSGVGFEIFDHQNLGTTEFVEKIDYQRALQGELARTIDGMSQVLESRVHLVLPTESLFKDDQKPATAAIVLKLRPGGTIGSRELQGIVHLVAASVRGLKEDQISVMSTDGRLLYTKQKEDQTEQLNTTELAIKQKMEQDLDQKIENMLERVVGPNKVIAKVDVDLNMDQVQIAQDTYDPDSAVIRSQERTTETAQGGDLEAKGSPDIQGKLLQSAPKATSQKSGTKSDRQTEVVNYEINKVSKHITQMPGGIDKLTVAVMVDGTYKTEAGADGKPKEVYVPRTPEQMATLQQLVQSAVGYSESRGDHVTVSNVAFVTDVSDAGMVKTQNKYLQLFKSWQRMIFNIAIVALVFLFIIRPIMKKFHQITEAGLKLPAPKGAPELEDPSLLIERPPDQITPRKKSAALVKYDPDRATEIIKQWLRDEV
ncbi:MAG: flagellar basal-body MS-ring/collar protein FliF [Syntrophobacteraceae bacterium]